jgi:sarcosine oxidase
MRESGRSVALVEAYGAGNPKSSSGGASRLIRMGYGADEIYTRWSLRSLEAWKELFHRARRPDLFQHTGVLWTARPGHPYAEHTRAVFEKLAIPHEVLSGDEVRRSFPLLHFSHDVAGILEPGSGTLLANLAVRAVADEAARLGVEAITARAAGVAGLPDAGAYIFACGPWLPRIFPEVIGGRILVTRQAVHYFDAPPMDMPSWIDFSDPRGGYAFPPMAGQGFKLALDRHGPEFDPDTGSREVTAAETSAARAFLRDRFPTLADAPLRATEVCQYENTSTGDFLLDRHPGDRRVWLAGGGSGHGFKHGPAVGEYLVRMLDGGEPDPRFALESKSLRFARAVY